MADDSIDPYYHVKYNLFGTEGITIDKSKLRPYDSPEPPKNGFEAVKNLFHLNKKPPRKTPVQDTIKNTVDSITNAVIDVEDEASQIAQNLKDDITDVAHDVKVGLEVSLVAGVVVIGGLFYLAFSHRESIENAAISGAKIAARLAIP